MECFKCLEEFCETQRTPRILTSCGHTLCQECISFIFTDKSVTCPQCETKSTSTNPSAFPANLALLQLAKSTPRDNCEKHGKSLEAYCNTDKRMLCVTCILEDGHKSHNISSISKASGHQKQHLRSLRSLAEQNKEFLSKETAEIRTVSQNASVTYEKLSQEYRNLYQALKESINSREQEVIGQLKSTLDNYLNSLEQKQTTNKQQLDLIDKFTSEMDKVERESDIQVIDRFTQREQLGRQASAKQQGLPKTNAFSGFTPEAEASFLWKAIKQTFEVPKTKSIKKPEVQSVFPRNLKTTVKNYSESLKSQNKKVPRKPKVVTKSIDLYKELKEPWESDLSAVVGNESEEETLSINSLDLASLCRTPNNYIYTLSGFSDEALKSVELYDCAQDKWTTVSNCIQPRTQFAALAFGTGILMIGGKEKGKRVSSAQLFDTKTNQVQKTKFSLAAPRSGFGCVSCGEDVYVVGGSDGVPVRNFEVWREEWSCLEGLKHRREELGAVLGPDNKIYALGGHGGPELSILKSAEAFNLETNTWEEIPPMKFARRALSCVAMPDGIYALGGYDGTRYLNKLEKFDIRMQKWLELSPMKFGRCTLSAVASGDFQHIYAIGGFNGKGLPVVERYSVVEDKWTQTSSLLSHRFMHASVLLSD